MSTRSVQKWAAVIGLSATAFVQNTSEFMPVGLLTGISQSFAMSESQTGLMISIYAWSVCLLSVPLMVWASKIEPRKLVLGLISVFAVGQLLSAAAPNFALLIVARLIVACAHAIFWAVAPPLAVRAVGSTAHEADGSRAMSMVIMGSSLASIVGLPIGRMLGLTFGWRVSFLAICTMAIMCSVYLFAVFPKLVPTERVSAAELPSLFKNKLLLSIYIFTLAISAGYYTAYSYIEPFLEQIGNLSANQVTLTLTIFGIAGLMGSLSFANIYAKARLATLWFTTGLLALAQFLIGILAIQNLAAAHFWMVGLCILLWGSCGVAFNVAAQAEIISATSEKTSAVAVAAFSGIFNLGIGSGSALGSVVFATSATQVFNVAAALVALGTCFCYFVVVPRLKLEMGREVHLSS